MSEFLLELPREQAIMEEPPFAVWRGSDGQLMVRFYRTGSGYLVRFQGRADFSVPADGVDVTCWPCPGTSARSARDLYLNQVLPMIQGQRGALIIHASGVAAPTGALGFVAPTGRGKSTLAAAFARNGVPFLSDDGLCLAREGCGFTVSSNRPSFRLWRDSEAAINPDMPAGNPGTEKSLVEAGLSLPFHAGSVPLRALYFLGGGRAAGPVIAPLAQQRAMAELINHSFLLDVTEPRRLRQHFEELGELAEIIPCYTLDYPRNYAALPEVISLILQHAALRVDDR